MKMNRRNKKKKIIGLFFGGLGNEAAISVISATNIAKNFDYEKYSLALIYWHRDNHFYLLEDINKINQVSEKNKIAIEDFSKVIDIALPITHGKYGEDGSLQGLLEIQKIPYCGCGVLSSSLCMDKVIFKTFLSGHRINQVRFDFFDMRGKGEKDVANWIKKIKTDFKLPVYVKPANSGSSIGISKVRDHKNLKKAVENAAAHDNKILIEQGLVGAREIEVAVLGNDELIISAPGELVLSGAFYDFDEKYVENKTTVKIPAKLDAAVTDKIKNLAEKVYRLCDCRGFARIDFFVKGKSVYLNEINTLPGFTDISMFPMLMKNSRVRYKSLINKIIALSE